MVIEVILPACEIPEHSTVRKVTSELKSAITYAPRWESQILAADWTG